LPSPYLTFILTLDEPLEVAVPSDPRQMPDVYETLLGGLHKTPTIIAHPSRQSGGQWVAEKFRNIQAFREDDHADSLS
jgi:hypothetical protein